MNTDRNSDNTYGSTPFDFTSPSPMEMQSENVGKLTPEQVKWLSQNMSQDDQMRFLLEMKNCLIQNVLPQKFVASTAAVTGAMWIYRKQVNPRLLGRFFWPVCAVGSVTATVLNTVLFPSDVCKVRSRALMKELYAKYSQENARTPGTGITYDTLRTANREASGERHSGDEQISRQFTPNNKTTRGHERADQPYSGDYTSDIPGVSESKFYPKTGSFQEESYMAGTPLGSVFRENPSPETEGAQQDDDQAKNRRKNKYGDYL
ncbi:hypothetical protein DdX_08209 [Ditylenchus destructor]|uniref:Uncharacterized protein n=1 Tax=Ditylenchus destructor TaxID=166010 RepID=A0AAD4N4T8_9BILA|nr:hypothetical protein DdX_08209 [Ditylenchus destructor]